MLGRYVNNGYAPGVDCIVYKNHKMIYRYFTGVSDIENKIAMTGNELYYIFSMSKLITVVGALTLLEKGKYSLNDNLSMYIPEFEKMQVKSDKTELFDANEITSGKSFGASENKSGFSEAKNRIIIEDLFTMSAGLNYNLNAEYIKESILCGKKDTVSIVKSFSK